MHPRTTEVLNELDSRRAELESAVAAVPQEERSRRPGPGRWSVAEIVEHLGLVEGRITPLILQNIATARAGGLGPERETAPVAPTLDAFRIVDRSTPITAGEASLPRSGLDAETALGILAQKRAALREALLGADGLALSTVVAPHQRFGPLNMYQWAHFIARHEARHTEQIRETAAAVRGQRPAG